MSKKQVVHYNAYLVWLAPILISCLTVLVYYQTLCYDFIYDDLPTIVNYVYIRIWEPYTQFLANSRWVSRVLNQFTYLHWKLNPTAFRVINLMMLVAIGLMVFTVVYKLLSNLKKHQWLKKNALLISSLTSALFLLHPVQTQTHVYICQMRLEGLVVFFTFAALMFYVFAVQAKTTVAQWSWYGVTLVTLLLGTGTKENVIVVPVLFALVDWFFLAEGDWNKFKKRIPMHIGITFVVWVMMFKYGFLNFGFFKRATTTVIGNNRGNILTNSIKMGIQPGNYMISQFKIILHYLAIFFFPVNIAFDYSYKLSQSIFSLDVVVPFLVLAGLTGYMIKIFLNNRSHVVPFCYAWFITAIIPRASIVPSTELVCDYKTYLSSFGAILFIAIFIAYVAQLMINVFTVKISYHQKLGLTSVFVLLIGFSSYSRNLVWRSELSFYEDLSSKCPKARWFNNLGTSQMELKRIAAAKNSFERSVELDNWYSEPHINLGVAYQNEGNRKKAMQHYARAIEIGEGHPQLFNNLGLLHMDMKNYKAAEICFNKALWLKPYYSRARIHLGSLYQQQGKKKEAFEQFGHAINGDLQTTDLFYIYGTMGIELGEHAKAVKALERLDKNYKETAFLTACCYYALSNYAQACDNFALSVKKHPDNLVYKYNYAQTLMNCGKFDQATPFFNACSKQPQVFPYAPLHLARCLIDSGSKDEGGNCAKQLIQTAQNDAVKRDALAFIKERGIA